MEVADIFSFDVIADAAKGAKLQLRHPVTKELLTHNEKPICLILLGLDSPQAQAAQIANANARLDASAGRLTAELLSEEMYNVLVACTTGWENIYEGGKPVEFSPAEARSRYKKFPWLFEQANKFIGDRANFTKA